MHELMTSFKVMYMEHTISLSIYRDTIPCLYIRPVHLKVKGKVWQNILSNKLSVDVYFYY